MKDENYTTYGEEWKKEMSKLPKAKIIEIASKIGQEKESVEERYEELYNHVFKSHKVK